MAGETTSIGTESAYAVAAAAGTSRSSRAQRGERDHLVARAGRQPRRDAAGVVRRRDLDAVEAAEVDPRERPQVGERLGAGRPADLGRARPRGERRVDEVDVERQERG